jgi:hypothetical protein
MFEDLINKYFTNEDGRFDPNEHVGKFALIYASIIFVTCAILKVMGVI